MNQCNWCGGEFEVNNRAKDHRFCSEKCRGDWHNKYRKGLYKRKKGQKIKEK